MVQAELVLEFLESDHGDFSRKDDLKPVSLISTLGKLSKSPEIVVEGNCDDGIKL